MKKLLYNLLIFVGVFSFSIFDVSASEHEIWDLIPIDTVSSVETEHFLYKDFYYKSSSDINGYTSIEFSSIENLSSKKMPVSISVGLFDSKKENIGVINYCSLADKSSSYSGTELSAGEKSAFSIKIKPDKYNSSDSDLSYVSYITIMDDNKYCKTGGATNFVGLDVEKMKNGITNKQLELNESTKQKQMIIKTAVLILSVVIVYMLFGSVVSSLYIRMYGVWTSLVYIPIINNYLSFKMSFGPLFGKILTGLMVLCVIFGMLEINIFIYICLFVVAFSLIINVVKILSGKYDLFYYDDENFSNRNNASYIKNDRERMNESGFSFHESQSIEDDNFGNSSSGDLIMSSTILSNNSDVNGDNFNNISDNVDYNANNTNNTNNEMIDINQNVSNDENISNDMQVFDINLNEKQDISYNHTSTEYFDMANADTLNQFESVVNSNNMSLSEFNELDSIDNNSAQNNANSITDEFSDEIIFNNNQDNDVSDGEDTDLTKFFS